MVARIAFALVWGVHGVGMTAGFFSAWFVETPLGFVPEPWVLPGDVGFRGPMGKAWSLIFLAATAATVVSVGALLGGLPWWRDAALAGGVLTLVAVLPWWRTVATGNRFGAVVSAAVVLALTLPQGAPLVRAIGG